jgi:WD40 repeat protein
MHEAAIGGLHLSRKEPKYCVSSSGYDLNICAWNLQTQAKIGSVTTSKLSSKFMLAQAPDLDLYAALPGATTPEIVLFKLNLKLEESKQALEKVMALNGHSKPLIWFDFSADICASISKDMTLVLQKIDKDNLKSLMIDKVQCGELQDCSRVAVFKIEGVGKEQERIYTGITHAEGMTVTCFTKQSSTYAV